MNRDTKDTANISLVALLMSLVIGGIIVCGILIATPFLVEWIVRLILLLLA
ncbi:hypothetical protein D3C87_323580 [compost metagenome]